MTGKEIDKAAVRRKRGFHGIRLKDFGMAGMSDIYFCLMKLVFEPGVHAQTLEAADN